LLVVVVVLLLQLLLLWLLCLLHGRCMLLCSLLLVPRLLLCLAVAWELVTWGVLAYWNFRDTVGILTVLLCMRHAWLCTVLLLLWLGLLCW
jgi:hypothetical protein